MYKWLGLYVVTHYQWQWNDEHKWVDFVKFNFHLNENIEWYCMQLELNPNLIKQKWDANWCIKYWKNATPKRHISISFRDKFLTRNLLW
jgi:hypothetical protein